MQTTVNIGVDVAKDSIVAACAEQPAVPRTIPNEPRALRAWLRTLPAHTRLGLEATGEHHVRLADLAYRQGLTVYVLNPCDTRHYAHALGRRAKTDRVDATLLARFVAQEHAGLRSYVPASPEARAIDRLLRRRARVVALKGALAMTLKDLPGIGAERAALLRRFEALLRRFDDRLQELVAACPERAAATQRLQGITGVGPLLGASLANTLQRLPFGNADAFVAFTGLDPRARDSGQKHGRRRLSKRGPSELRRLLFTAAMSASRTRVWRPFYEHERAKGLSSTAALVILARRIARTAWSIHRHRTTFLPERLCHA